MHIEELEDLQVVAVDSISELFPNNKSVLEEEVISRAAVEMSMSVSELIKHFQPNKLKKQKPEEMLRHLNWILRWALITAHVLGVEVPEVEDVEQDGTDWPDEVHQCGILASIMLQHRSCNITLDFFLTRDEDVTEDAANDLWDIISLVEILSKRLDSNLKEVLVTKP